jgi:pimeloyl-ACP methyl ester carboxylesterase
VTDDRPSGQALLPIESGLEYRVAGSGDRALVFLHHGLGSAATWRDLPADLARSTGWKTVAYSRSGHGWSGPLAQPPGVDFMHVHARETLPRVLDEIAANDVVLVGHSDGASIALILAGDAYPVSGLVLIAPHVFVEDETVAGIEAAVDQFQNDDLAVRLGRYHRDPTVAFHAWSGIWLDPAFRGWNIVDSLPGVTCPVLVIQALDDEYGTIAQVDTIEQRVSGPVRRFILPDGGHSPHQAHPDLVIEAITDFVAEVGR